MPKIASRVIQDRNDEIWRRKQAGWKTREIVADMDLNSTLVAQILHRMKRDCALRERAMAGPPPIPPGQAPAERIKLDRSTQAEIAAARREAATSPPFKGRID